MIFADLYNWIFHKLARNFTSSSLVL